MSNTYKVNLPTQTVSNYTLTTASGYNGTWSTNVNPVITVGNNPDSLVVKGNVVINGINLEERLKTIEKVLMIPERDATMEAKYPSLKKKYDEYIKELSKYRMWESLKGNEND